MKRKIKRLNYLAAMVAVIILTLSITACETTPRVEYIHDIPDVTFPVFPPPDSVTYDEETDLVSMPLWYWRDIAKYKIDVDAIEKYINELRELGGNMEANDDNT